MLFQLVSKIPIDDLLNEIKRFVYARAKVSLHFSLDNYSLKSLVSTMQKEIGEERDSVQVFTLPEL